MYQAMEQVHEEYSGDWVFMIKCKEGQFGTVAGGEVVINSANRDIVIRNMEKYDYEPGLTYFGYVGKIPESTSVIL